MNVIVAPEHNPYSLDPARLEKVCEFALEESGAPSSSEVSLTLVDNDEMASLNERYRGIVGPTDVLSFECDNLDDDFPIDEKSQDNVLGDIIIAPEIAMRQSKEYATSLEEEIDLLCVHGILHLQGYDHIVDEDAEEMEALQSSILDKWKSREATHA